MCAQLLKVVVQQARVRFGESIPITINRRNQIHYHRAVGIVQFNHLYLFILQSAELLGRDSHHIHVNLITIQEGEGLLLGVCLMNGNARHLKVDRIGQSKAGVGIEHIRLAIS